MHEDSGWTWVHQRLDELRVEIHQQAVSHARAMGYVRGAALVGAVLLGAINWYAVRQLDHLLVLYKQQEALANRIALLERRVLELEGPKGITRR